MRQIGIKIRKVLQCTGAPKPVEDSLVNISTESDVHRTVGTVWTLNTAIDLALLSFPNLAALNELDIFASIEISKYSTLDRKAPVK